MQASTLERIPHDYRRAIIAHCQFAAANMAFSARSKYDHFVLTVLSAKCNHQPVGKSSGRSAAAGVDITAIIFD
jgi:hypothetical protein